MDINITKVKNGVRLNTVIPAAGEWWIESAPFHNPNLVRVEASGRSTGREHVSHTRPVSDPNRMFRVRFNPTKR